MSNAPQILMTGRRGQRLRRLLTPLQRTAQYLCDLEPAKDLPESPGLPAPGVAELDGFTLLDTGGRAQALLGFDDLGDGDNHVVVCVPPGVEPATLVVRADTLYDPTNNPNPETSADVIRRSRPG